MEKVVYLIFTRKKVGRSFHERTKDILLDLEEARVVAAQLEDHPSGLIRLSVPTSMESHLTAAMGDFQARWPSVIFSLDFTDRLVDLVGEGFDLAVRVGRLEDSTLRARKIGEARRTLCASPRYLSLAGTCTRNCGRISHTLLNSDSERRTSSTCPDGANRAPARSFFSPRGCS